MTQGLDQARNSRRGDDFGLAAGDSLSRSRSQSCTCGIYPLEANFSQPESE
jgi:hypothetical protein